MERGLTRFEVAVWPRMPLGRVLRTPSGILGALLGVAVAWLVSATNATGTEALMSWVAVFVTTVFVGHHLSPPVIVLGLEGMLLQSALRPRLIPWVRVSAVHVEATRNLFRRQTVLVLRLSNGDEVRIPSSNSYESMTRVQRIVEGRLSPTRPRVPNVLSQVETSRRAAEDLLLAPQGKAYREDGLTPEGWWGILESSWALPHERVAAALALGTEDYLTQIERAESVLQLLASRALARVVRRAFLVSDAARADRLLRKALRLGGQRAERRLTLARHA